MQIQWLGHSAFKLSGEKATILIDPFLTGNPKFSGDRDQVIEGVTHVLLTHGHNDHFGDTLDIVDRTGATFISTPELAGYVGSKSGKGETVGMNIGGTFAQDGFSVTMVRAFHSSSYTEPDGTVIYGGMPTGMIVHMDGHKIYHMGDTTLYGDMGLIDQLFAPDIGIVPMGGHFTMDADVAALAVNRYFHFTTVIPCHYGTFPILAPSAEPFAKKVTKGHVEIMEPMGVLKV